MVIHHKGFLSLEMQRGDESTVPAMEREEGTELCALGRSTKEK